MAWVPGERQAKNACGQSEREKREFFENAQIEMFESLKSLKDAGRQRGIQRFEDCTRRALAVDCCLDRCSSASVAGDSKKILAALRVLPKLSKDILQ
jgi:hypothetical protein